MSPFRKDFPIFITHPDLVFLDSASSSQKPKMVIDAITQYLESSYSNIHRGSYELSEISEELFEQSNTDYDLSNIDSKLKDYVFKLSKLSDKEQESIMNLIDVMYEKYSK